jgi:hypothetical protein
MDRGPNEKSQRLASRYNGLPSSVNFSRNEGMGYDTAFLGLAPLHGVYVKRKRALISLDTGL